MKLNAWNMSDGTVEIHRHGCQHKPGRKGTKSPFYQDQVEFHETDWATKYDFCHDYWDNGILDEYESEYGHPMDVFVEMNFKPCTKDLPEGGPEVPATTTKTGSQAVRAAARLHLWSYMEQALNDSLMTADPDVKAMMVEQSERVAKMFGMRD